MSRTGERRRHIVKIENLETHCHVPRADRRFAHPPSSAFVGYMLIAIVLLSAIVLLHHPIAQGHDPAAIIGSIQRQARMDNIIHGAMAIIFGLLTVAIFAVPAIASVCSGHVSQACTANTILLLRLSSIQIELYTRFAFFAIAVAILAWGVALMATPTAPRWAGATAIALGALQLLGLFLVTSRFTPQSLLIVSGAQFAWYILVAVLLIRKMPR